VRRPAPNGPRRAPAGRWTVQRTNGPLGRTPAPATGSFVR